MTSGDANMDTSSPGTSDSKGASKYLVVCRHGERLDFTFNQAQHHHEHQQDWISRCFGPDGKYRRFNINMPRGLPVRHDGYRAYSTDTPLTEIGYLQAKITGKAIRDAGVKVIGAYCSPAYRCVQTCVGILKGMQNNNVKINIEPGLFEWCGWYKQRMPSWLYPEEFQAQGHSIDIGYSSFYRATDMRPDETIEDYYDRSHRTVEKVLARHIDTLQSDNSKMAVLCVAHGASLDTCTRQLCGMPPRPTQEFYEILHRTPYLAVSSARLQASGTWNIAEPPILPFYHEKNGMYNWRMLNPTTAAKPTSAVDL